MGCMPRGGQVHAIRIAIQRLKFTEGGPPERSRDERCNAPRCRGRTPLAATPWPRLAGVARVQVPIIRMCAMKL